MYSEELIKKAEAILDETSGDETYADLFIQIAKLSAGEIGGQVAQSYEVFIQNEVKEERKNWERKKKFLL